MQAKHDRFPPRLRPTTTIRHPEKQIESIFIGLQGDGISDRTGTFGLPLNTRAIRLTLPSALTHRDADLLQNALLQSRC